MKTLFLPLARGTTAFIVFVMSGWFAVPAFSTSPLKVIQIDTPMKGSKLFVPNDGKTHPGILLLHGSEGGSLPYYWTDAQMLAGHGYAVLAFCWYNCGKNPITDAYEDLENVDLNKTYDAFVWLKHSAHVNKAKTGIVGVSRGAEQSLVLGWKMAERGGETPSAIAVHAPSDVVVTGFNWSGMDRRCWICTSFDAACFNGTADTSKWDWQNIRWNVACGSAPKDPSKSRLAAWIWEGKPLATGTRIEIEKYSGPVFVTHGTEDEYWLHDRSIAIEKTLAKAGRKPEVHIFPGEKHVFTTKSENRRLELLVQFLAASLN
jgi:dienelactone hydrolase